MFKRLRASTTMNRNISKRRTWLQKQQHQQGCRRMRSIGQEKLAAAMIVRSLVFKMIYTWWLSNLWVHYYRHLWLWSRSTSGASVVQRLLYPPSLASSWSWRTFFVRGDQDLLFLNSFVLLIAGLSRKIFSWSRLSWWGRMGSYHHFHCREGMSS